MRPAAGLTEIVDDRDDAVRDIGGALPAWFPASTHPGGFAWEAATGQLPARIAVVRDARGAVVGWAGCSPDDARVECAPGDDATTAVLAAWVLDVAGDGPVSVAVHRGQDHLRGILADRGFVDEEVPLAGLRHPARDTGARPPAGYAIRPVAYGEERLRVDAHRRAWRPADLPFTDGSGDGIDPAAESRFDDRAHAAVRASAPYRPDLDLVVEAPGAYPGRMTVDPQATVRPLRGSPAPDVAAAALVAAGARIVGRVSLGAGSSVWFNAVLRAEAADIAIGAGSNLQDNVSCHVDDGFPLTVGTGVSVGHGAVLHGCTIEDDCIVGMSATVMNGAVVGRESLLAGGTVVLEGQVVPPRSLVAGVPGKVRRELTDEEVAGLRANAAHYVENARRHAEMGS